MCILRFLNFIFWLFLAISFFFICLPETFLSLNQGNLPQLRQVMIISDMMFKMGDKLHVCKYSKNCIGLIDIVPLCSGLFDLMGSLLCCGKSMYDVVLICAVWPHSVHTANMVRHCALCKHCINLHTKNAYRSESWISLFIWTNICQNIFIF